MLGQECLATDCLSILNFLGLSVCFFLIFHPPSWAHFSTGKSLSEALIFASTIPQYDERLFIELQAQTWGEHVVYKNCSECQKQFLYTKCSPQV